LLTAIYQTRMKRHLRMRNRFINIVFLTLCFGFTNPISAQTKSKAKPSDIRKNLVDVNATEETVAMYYNLKKLSGQKILFGQQDATASGIGWYDNSGRCDIKDICGSYPAFYSWDIMDFTRPDTTNGPYETKIRKLTIEAYNRGGVNSYCWHFWNPVTNKSFYDTTRVVNHILPGGSHHQLYKEKLAIVAKYINTLRGKKGELIPIIFRPYHELDGNWFWWGSKFCTVDEFKQLYRFTVTYLRDTLKVRNFLYAFSPDCRFSNEEQYLERYPGDEYVDIVGMDNYWDFNPKGGGLDAFQHKLMIISDYAQKKHKLAALTETGFSNLTDTTWYTKKLMKALTEYPDKPKLAYVAIWRNNKQSFYSPPPGHPAVKNFIDFYNNPYVIFEDKLPNMYSFESD